MKEKFDISHYLNIEMPPELKQSLSDFHSKRPISAKLEKKQAEQSESSLHSPVSEQTLPSEPLNKVKEAVKAEHSEQEKQQAVSSSPRRISHKQRQESLESYREAFLIPQKSSTERQAISVASRGNAWSSLSVAWAITGRMFRVSWSA